MKLLRPLLLLTGLTLILYACSSSGVDEMAQGDGDGESSDDGTGTTADDGSTGDGAADDGGSIDHSSFAEGVLPIVEASCARCHTGDGPGTQHVRFDTAQDVLDNAGLIASVVDLGFMPPWPASDESIAFTNDYGLTTDEREALVSWASFGASLDIAPSTPIEPSVETFSLSDVDMTIVPDAGYDGTAGQPDEYRCLIYDPGFTEETWLTGYEFVPDQAAVVHHAIGYLVGASQMERARELDAAQPDNAGYSCFGGSRLGEDEIFLGWAPGQGPTELPDGSGLPMGPGDFLVIQIHYHYDVEAPEDLSTIDLDIADESDGVLDAVDTVEFLAPAEIPCFDDEEGPLCDRAAAVANAIEKYGPEGVRSEFTHSICGTSPEDFELVDGRVTTICDLPARSSGQLISVLGHEHELGASFRMVLNPDTSDEIVLLDIPRWDFNWQLNYYPVDDIFIRPNDVIRMECTWDRNLRDPELEPAYIVWADGTDDEMCFGTIVVRTE